MGQKQRCHSNAMRLANVITVIHASRADERTLEHAGQGFCNAAAATLDLARKHVPPSRRMLPRSSGTGDWPSECDHVINIVRSSA